MKYFLFYLHSTTSGRRILKNLSIPFRFRVRVPKNFLSLIKIQFYLITVVPPCLLSAVCVHRMRVL